MSIKISRIDLTSLSPEQIMEVLKKHKGDSLTLIAEENTDSYNQAGKTDEADRIKNKIALYNNLAGKAKELDEDIKELLKIAGRTEEWRGDQTNE